MKPNNQPMVETELQETAARIAAELNSREKIQQMAELGGISEQAVYKWCREGKISKKNLRLLAKFTGKSVDHFISGTDDPTRTPSDDLAECVELLDEFMPADEFPMPPKRRIDLAKKMCSDVKPDGTIEMAKVLQLIRPIKDKYRKK